MFKKCAACILALFLATAGCERTTVEGPGESKLVLTEPSDTSITRGSTAKVTVSVDRVNFDDPIAVEFSQLPEGVTVVDTEQTIEGEEKTFVLSADPDASLVSNHRAIVSVRGPNEMVAQEELVITVEEQS